MNCLELLSDSHDRASFDCGSEPLNRFIQQVAKQHLPKGISRTFVLVAASSKPPKEVIGFFSLSACEGDSSELPDDVAKKLPRRIPAARLGRLAVDKRFQGQGVGKALLMAALMEIHVSAQHIGIAGLFVDAKDEQLGEFYKKFGFVPLPTRPLTLFLRIETISQAVQHLGK